MAAGRSGSLHQAFGGQKPPSRTGGMPYIEMQNMNPWEMISASVDGRGQLTDLPQAVLVNIYSKGRNMRLFLP